MKHILVVDDEAPIRELLGTYFQRHGFKVSMAGSASDATRIARETICDLIILDVVLSDADGLDVLEKLKTEHHDVPIIVMTGIGFDEPLIREAKEKGASAYVSKTLPLDKLLTEVQTQLSMR
jgi:two-component system, OmpR family, response regulator